MRRPAGTKTSATSRLSNPFLSEGGIRALLVVLAVGHLALGVWMALSPGTFFRGFAAFGTRNDHYVRDVGTLYVALGLVLLAAVRRPSWRTPILLFAVLQYGFHLLNHVIDIGDSQPGWIGPADVAALAAMEVLLIVLVGASRRTST